MQTECCGPIFLLSWTFFSKHLTGIYVAPTCTCIYDSIVNELIYQEMYLTMQWYCGESLSLLSTTTEV